MDGIELIVRGNFDGYVPGDVINDPAKIAEILSGTHENDVIKRKIQAPVAPPTK